MNPFKKIKQINATLNRLLDEEDVHWREYLIKKGLNPDTLPSFKETVYKEVGKLGAKFAILTGGVIIGVMYIKKQNNQTSQK